jgi:hypothetical protein
MAAFNSNQYKSFILDGEARDITPRSKISDFVPDSATSVVVTSPAGESRIIGRAGFSENIPPEYSLTTNHSDVTKG